MRFQNIAQNEFSRNHHRRPCPVLARCRRLAWVAGRQKQKPMSSIIFALLAAFAAYRFARHASERERLDTEAEFFRTLAQPPFFIQAFPGDRTCFARRDEFVTLLEKHGNKWRDQMPVCCYVYGDKVNKESTIGLTWAQFVETSLEDYRQTLRAWSAKVEGANAGAAATHILNQVPT